MIIIIWKYLPNYRIILKIHDPQKPNPLYSMHIESCLICTPIFAQSSIIHKSHQHITLLRIIRKYLKITVFSCIYLNYYLLSAKS